MYFSNVPLYFEVVSQNGLIASSSIGKYCGDLVKSNAINCDNKSDCFCKGEYCLAGGKCFYGDVFIRGKAIANSDWDMLDRHVICRQMGFWKAKGDSVTTTRLYYHP